MSLTPGKDDPNRKAELERRKKEPHTFGDFTGKPLPKDWAPTPLKAIDVVEEEEEDEDEDEDEDDQAE